MPMKERRWAEKPTAAHYADASKNASILQLGLRANSYSHGRLTPRVKAVFPYVAGRIPGSPFRLRSAECRGLDEKPGTFTYSRLSCEIVSYDGQARGTIAVRPTSPTTFRWTRRENRDREWEQEQAVVHPRERGGEEGADQRHRPKLDHASGLACSILVRMRMSGRERRSKTLGSEALRS
jgi:hypothetical protein